MFKKSIYIFFYPLFLINFFPLLSRSQVYRFRSINSSLTNLNDTTAKLVWKKDNTLIVQSMKDNTIKFYSPDEITLAWIESEVQEVGETEKFVKSRVKYSAIDANGEKCKFQIDMMKPKEVGYDAILYFWHDKEILTYMANIIN